MSYSTNLDGKAMDLFGKDSPWRPLVLTWIIYLVLGYILFFASVFMPAFSWRDAFIDYFMPILKALNTAKKVALIRESDPFPAQLMIIYAAYGTILISAICFFYTVFLKDIRSYYLSSLRKEKITRLKLFIAGFFGILMAIFLYPRMLFVLDPEIIFPRDILPYSSDFVSATMLLFFGICNSVFIALGICAIYSSFLMKK